MKFNVSISNPPYVKRKVDGNLTGSVLWADFVKRFVPLSEDSSYIHPPIWRRPANSDSQVDMFRYIADRIKYLSINDIEAGKRVFGAGSRFDWWTTGNASCVKINDADGRQWELDLSEWDWLPNKDFDFVKSLLGEFNEDRVIFGSAHHASRDHVHPDPNRFPHQVVHSTAGGRDIRSTWKGGGAFGKPKVIFSETGVGDPIVDLEGEYGLTQQAIGVPVSGSKEAERVVSALKSDGFERLTDACSWSTYRIDYRMIQYFRDDWYDQLL